MKAFAGVLVGLALTLAGCSLGDDDEPLVPGGAQGEAASSDGETIRAWSAALNRGDYGKAASYFAEDAIVEQTEEVRLPDRDAAVAFNRSLPCKADVTDIEDEGDTILAAFRLRRGPGGGCEGAARVRFRFEDGKFSEWRQLAEPPPAEGEIA